MPNVTNAQLSLSDQWRLLKPAWRICVAILAAQVIGAIVGLALQLVGQAFLNLWYGAAYATPIGFLLGLAWQAVSAAGVARHRLVISFLAALSVLLPLFGYLTREIWALPIAG